MCISKYQSTQRAGVIDRDVSLVFSPGVDFGQEFKPPESECLQGSNCISLIFLIFFILQNGDAYKIVCKEMT